MPETAIRRRDQDTGAVSNPLIERVRQAEAGLTALLRDAERARELRAEMSAKCSSAVCAWNYFENIPTFYNWNNRPR